MTKRTDENIDVKATRFLDISGEVCPMTFVRTKLMLESMKNGETVLILLHGEEPLKNVPRNLTDHGEEIVLLKTSPGMAIPGVHRLLVRKTSS